MIYIYIYQESSQADVYEFVASSVGERDKWIKILLERITFIKKSPDPALKMHQRRSVKVKGCTEIFLEAKLRNEKHSRQF